MKSVFAFAFSLLLTVAASAQNYVYQNGGVTPNHAVRWITNGVVGDGGTAANGFLSSIGVLAQGPAICQQSAAPPSPYNQICLGVNTAGPATISLQSYGGATAQGLNFVINGVTYPFPGSGNGDVSGPPSSNSGDLAVWNGTGGTLLADGGRPAVNVMASPYGAKCDGSTDDTTAIQSAMTTVLAAGGEIDFPDSTCVISSALIIPSGAINWVMRGLGRAATLKQSTNNTQIFIFNSQVSRWRITNFHLTWASAQPSSNTSSVGFWFTGNGLSIYNWEADHLTFDNGFRGFSDDGATSPLVWGNHVDHVWYNDTMTGGFYNTTPAISAGQPNTSLDHIYIAANDIVAAEPIIILSAVDGYALDEIEINGDVNGAQLLSIVSGSTGHIGSMRLETATLTTNNSKLVNITDSIAQIDNFSIAAVTLAGSSDTYYLFDFGGLSASANITNLTLGSFSNSGGNVFYAFASNLPEIITVGTINGLVGVSGVYLSNVGASKTAQVINVTTWQSPQVLQVGDSGYSWTAGSSAQTLEFNTTLTANRTITIQDNDTGSDSNLFSGYGPHIVRDAAVPGVYSLFIKNSAGTTIATLPGNGAVNLAWWRQGSPASFGWEIGANSLPNNTLLGNTSGGTAGASPQAIPSCSATSDALNWTSSTGFGCVTGYAPLASPTFSGTVTAPDSGTWTSGGINGSAIGGTTAAAAHFTSLNANGNVFFTGLTSGSGSAALCLNSSGSQVESDTNSTICGISALRYKNLISEITPEEGLRGVLSLRGETYRYKLDAPGQDGGKNVHVSLIADDIAAMNHACAEYSNVGVENYMDRCVEAYMVEAIKELKLEVEQLKAAR